MQQQGRQTKLLQNPWIFPNSSVAAAVQKKKKNANIQMSWVELFQERQLFKHFGQRSTNNSCKNLTKTKIEQQWRLPHLTFWTTSQERENNEATLTLWGRATLSQESKIFVAIHSIHVFTPPLYLRGHWQQKQRGWLALLLVKRRPSQGTVDQV